MSINQTVEYPGITLSAKSYLRNETRGLFGQLLDTSKPDLNGFIINQNLSSGTAFNTSNYLTHKVVLQEFKLPTDFARGEKYPEFTGFHLHLKCNDRSYTISYEIQAYDQTYGWQGIVYGTYTGSPTASMIQWAQINFDPINIKNKYLNQKFRLILNLDNKVDGLYTSDANPFKSKNCFLLRQLTSNGVTNIVCDNTEIALRFRLMGNVADEGIDILGNRYRSLVYRQSISNTLDYNTSTWWMSKANPSKYAVESIYFNLGGKTSIDAIFLDPATPNMVFNVYYSDETDDPTPSIAGWDNIMWKRVPKEFIASKRQNYIFPSPISTKFIKIEFTNLQAKPYLTGDFQRPMIYNKYPQWVFDYFIAQYAYQRNMSYDPFVANEIDINFDLLDLAFNYYKGDIIQYSTNPSEIKVVNEKTEKLDQTLRSLLVDNTDGVSNLDVETMMKVKTNMEPFLNHPAFNADVNTQAGSAALSAANFNNYPIEDIISIVASTSVVSNHNREHLITEKLMPNMYFFIECRHGYREALAKLPDGKGYFAGVKEIGFQKQDHKVVYDNSIYMTVAGNALNSAFNDFEYDGIAWVSR